MATTANLSGFHKVWVQEWREMCCAQKKLEATAGRRRSGFKGASDQRPPKSGVVPAGGHLGRELRGGQTGWALTLFHLTPGLGNKLPAQAIAHSSELTLKSGACR